MGAGTGIEEACTLGLLFSPSSPPSALLPPPSPTTVPALLTLYNALLYPRSLTVQLMSNTNVAGPRPSTSPPPSSTALEETLTAYLTPVLGGKEKAQQWIRNNVPKNHPQTLQEREELNAFMYGFDVFEHFRGAVEEEEKKKTQEQERERETERISDGLIGGNEVWKLCDWVA